MPSASSTRSASCASASRSERATGSGATARSASGPPTGSLPERLPYAQFRATLNGLRERASRCRTSGLSPKTVKLHVSISAAGVTENVKYKNRVGTAAFKRCIINTVKTVRFGRAQNGQTLGYTFQF